jgi:hypothetical protein
MADHGVRAVSDQLRILDDDTQAESAADLDYAEQIIGCIGVGVVPFDVGRNLITWYLPNALRRTAGR